MKSRFGQINDQFDNGDHVSDNDLQYFIEKLENLYASLSELGGYPPYVLMQRDVWKRLEACYGYRLSRGMFP